MTQNKMSKTKKTILIVAGVVVALLLIGLLSGDSEQKDDSVKTPEQSVNKSESKPADKPVEQSKPKDKSISQSDAENVCQDANFLQNYISLSDTSIVTFSYSPDFSDMGDGTKSLQWNGKDKKADKSILFMCDVAKDGDKTVVEQLVIDGDVVYER